MVLNTDVQKDFSRNLPTFLLNMKDRITTLTAEAIDVASASPACFMGNINIMLIIIFTRSAAIAIFTGVLVSCMA